MTINPNSPSQEIMSTIDSGKNMIGGSLNTSQTGIPQQTITVSSLTPENSTTHTTQIRVENLMSTDLPSSNSTALQVQGGRRRLNSNDFISQMSNDILAMILSQLSIKEAAATSILSSRWRFVWCNVTRLNFDSTQISDMVEPDQKLYVFERFKYINQVNSVIRSYEHPSVQDIKIRFSLTNQHKGVIDEWLRFAVNKKVDYLELDLTDNRIHISSFHYYPNYDFPHLEIVSLKKLVLKTVNVKESVLHEFLTNCPHLETIVIHEPLYLNHIHVGGRPLSLKHFEIVAHSSVRCIYLTDFDLVSFTYKGCSVDLRMSNLPKLKEVNLYQQWGWSYHNLFHPISSCALSLEALSLYVYPMEYITLDPIPELPNVRKLRLEIGGSKCKCLQELALILNACPNLEPLTIVPFWTSPIINKRKARDLTNAHQRLKYVEILGYYGRNCDIELAAYLIHTCVALKKIVIDTCWRSLCIPLTTYDNYLKNREAAVSSAKSNLESILPCGAELCML